MPTSAAVFSSSALPVGAAASRAFFVHGFAKNQQDNIHDDELMAFRMLAAEMMAYDDETLAKVVANGTLIKVLCND